MGDRRIAGTARCAANGSAPVQPLLDGLPCANGAMARPPRACTAAGGIDMARTHGSAQLIGGVAALVLAFGGATVAWGRPGGIRGTV